MATVQIQSFFEVLVGLLTSFVLPNLTVLFISFASVWFAFSVADRRRKEEAKESVRAEIRNNVLISKSIVDYTQRQLEAGDSIAPMPRFHLGAFQDYKRLGLFTRLAPARSEELESLYIHFESVNEAGRRQEDLAFGPASAYPNAHQLRLENLTYVQDTIHNVVEPYQDRIREMKL